MEYLPTGALDLDPQQSGKRRDEPRRLASLKANIQQRGLLHPLLARPYRDDPERFRVYAGGRRLLALRQLQAELPGEWDFVPCFITEGQGDVEALVDSISENVHRQDLTALEKGENILQLIAAGLNMKQIAPIVNLDYGLIRDYAAGTRHAIACPDLMELDRQKPIPERILKVLPKDPELLDWTTALWRDWEGDVEPLAKRITRKRKGIESPEIPGGRGASRIDRFQACVKSLTAVCATNLLELGPLTAAEAVEVQRLQHWLGLTATHLQSFAAPTE
ncbi:MAG: ParB/RepB/Spo0J family partition protein [Armatimonadota bacterium]